MARNASRVGQAHQFSHKGEDNDRPCNGSHGHRQEHVCTGLGQRTIMCDGLLHTPPPDPREACGDPGDDCEKGGKAPHSYLGPGQVDGEDTCCRGEHAQGGSIQARKVAR